MAARLTPAQQAFLATIPTERDEHSHALVWWDCEPHEVRTATALGRKGVIEFHSGKPPQTGEHFSVRQKAKA